MADNEPEDHPNGGETKPESTEDGSSLAADEASAQFFKRPPSELIPDDLETKPAGPKTPLDSPSVQFFGKHLEDFAENADDVLFDPAPGPDESPTVRFFGEKLPAGSSDDTLEPDDAIPPEDVAQPEDEE